MHVTYLLFIYIRVYQIYRVTRMFSSMWMYTNIYIVFACKMYFLNCNISVQFVAIKQAENDHTLQTVNTEFETTAPRFIKIQYISSSRTTWKHSHVYRVNRGAVHVDTCLLLIGRKMPFLVGLHSRIFICIGYS